MNKVLSRIHATYNSLRQSGKEIADYVLQHAHERFDLSITEFAVAVHLSETTISRFCRVIGYESFHDFKFSLAAAQPRFRCSITFPLTSATLIPRLRQETSWRKPSRPQLRKLNGN